MKFDVFPISMMSNRFINSLLFNKYYVACGSRLFSENVKFYESGVFNPRKIMIECTTLISRGPHQQLISIIEPYITLHSERYKGNLNPVSMICKSR